MENSKCKCGNDLPEGLKQCRTCDRAQFVSAAKNLGGHLVGDVKGLFGKLKKVRITTAD